MQRSYVDYSVLVPLNIYIYIFFIILLLLTKHILQLQNLKLKESI